MAKILLNRTAHLVEISEEDNVTEDDLRIIESLLERDFYINGVTFKCISSRPTVLDTLIDNVGKCNNCGAWTTDCTGENPEKDLSYGAYVEGCLFCDECLPQGHPLRFTST